MSAMTAGLAVAALWALVILRWAWATRPLPQRRSVGRAPLRERDSTTTSAQVVVATGVSAIGRAMRRVARRADDDAADVRAGVAVCVALASVAIDVRLVPFAAAAAAFVPAWRARTAARTHQIRLAADAPEVIDLLRLAVGSGLNLRLALPAVASRSPPSWRAALLAIDERIALGEPLTASLDDAGRRLGDGAGPLLRMLAVAERDGTPLLPALSRLADEARLERRRSGEEAARRLPVKLLFPLVLCVLPAFALLAIAPLLASAFGSLSL